jgi:hypothetical protein
MSPQLCGAPAKQVYRIGLVRTAAAAGQSVEPPSIQSWDASEFYSMALVRARYMHRFPRFASFFDFVIPDRVGPASAIKWRCVGEERKSKCFGCWRRNETT